MADNHTLPGTGDVSAADDRGGVKFQKVLINSFDGPSCDAFGRWRVSNPVSIFESKLLESDDAPLYWDESLESGAGITATTPTAAKPYIDIISTNVTAGKFTRQTFRRFGYHAGKSQLILMTGVLELASGVKTGCERRIGLFDDDNGAYFESDAGTIGITTRSNDSGTPVDTTIAQTAWNLDTLDGDDDSANPSGLTADFTKAQIFVIDYQWLSVGRVRFGLEIDGVIVYVHEKLVANVDTIPWASTPNLPVRFQIITTSSSGICSMRCICSSVISEGGEDPIGTPRSFATTAHVNANTADIVYALVGLRFKTTHLGCTIEPSSISILSETADNFEWQLILNPTVAGTFTYSDLTNSCLQTAVGATANTITNGTIIARGFGASASAASSSLQRAKLKLGASIAGVVDELVLCVRPLGANADIQGALNWLEIY